MDTGGSKDEAAWAAIGRCVVNVWNGAITVDAIAAIDAFVDRIAAQRGPVGMLVVVAASTPLAQKRERDAIERFYTDKAERLSAVAQVIEGSGMRASAVLSAVTAIGLLQRRAYPRKTFQSVDAAAQWLAAQCEADSRARSERQPELVAEVNRQRRATS